MALVYQKTLNESTVLITHPSPSSFALTNNPRLDSAICMPSSKKPSACSNSVKSRCDIKKNEGLERWVEDLLMTLDGVMEKTLGTAVERNSGLRVKELMKQIDDRLSKDSEETIIAEEFTEDKTIDCEQLADDGLSDDVSTKVHTQSDRTISYQDVTADATTLKQTLTEQKCSKNPVSKVKNLFRKKKKTKKSVKPSSGQSVVNTKTPPKTPPKQRIECPRESGRKATIIGRIEKKGKRERLLNDRFLLNKKDIIGEGHHGSVMRGIDLQTKEKVAIKCLRKQYKVTVGTFQVANTKQRKKNDELINEGRMMVRMESIPDLVPLLDLVETAKKVYYIMPLATKDLSDIIYRRRLTEQNIREIMKPIFQAIKQMHDSGYVHRDIKPENILLYEDDQAKLGDFGLATEFGCQSGFQVVGTPAFAAPEVLGQFLRTDASAWLNYKRADVWSLGATMYTSFVGRYPFDDKRTASDDLKREVQFPDKFKHYSEEAKDLIAKLMIPDPTKRITIDDALNHPFFTNHSQ
ncbi:7443_t:CDS:2 [Paraglomus brasilianum]|uniref:7443_t:CDS:1 n=1 Tax=Paraglomus brasilianum TaxID=144538 RepID=A0A9N9CHM7_9GLOM|nr:7443_t:CDS:2 [Paraglomus brasilianum]